MWNDVISSQLASYSWLVIVLAIWSLIWKGFALWKAAHRSEKYWFIALLIINLAGLLEMLYIFVITPWIDSRKGKKVQQNPM
jgi:predicted Na+-dependent transporter